MPKDLVVLAADKNIDYGIRGLLSRPAALGIRPILASTDTFVHQHHDPGCAKEAHAFLRPMQDDYRHALVVFDRMGSGREALSRAEISEEVRGRLAASGWGRRAESVVLDPELEIWVFAASPQVERCIGWPAGRSTLRRWLAERGLWDEGQTKPADPKAALELALREVKKPRSSAIYKQLGERVGVQGCTDPAFEKFRDTLRRWFPAAGGE
jgi:hypothetical protein